MSILVTGGLGFIGSHLVNRLVEQGYDVDVVDNLHTGTLDKLNPKTQFYPILRDALQNENKEYTTIFHLGIPSSSPMYRVNKDFIWTVPLDMKEILEYAAMNNSIVILASTSSLYHGNPLPFNESMPIYVNDLYTEVRYYLERLCEFYAKYYGISAIALRLFSVYGEGEETKGKYANLITQIILAAKRNKPFIVYGDGNQARDFIHVDDVVNAFILAMKHALRNRVQFDVFNVGTGKMITIRRVMSLIETLTGVQVPRTYVKNPIQNYVYRTCADTEKASKVLGFKPEIDLPRGILRVAKYHGLIE